MPLLLDKGFSKAEVAQDIGVHRSTISREISRNSVANYCLEQTETLGRQLKQMISILNVLKKGYHSAGPLKI